MPEPALALFIYKRPDLTEQVFAKLRAWKPERLFVIADGPRTELDAPLCEAARLAATSVDWDCELRTNFSEVNLRGPQRFATGMAWLFEQVDSAIILEDDCLPAESLLAYCGELLERYQDDERIMHIAGANCIAPVHSPSGSYYKSKYVDVWGWATWRRAWRHFDLAIPGWPQFREERLDQICRTWRERIFWRDVFDRAFHDGKRHWDFAWQYACWSQNGFALAPCINMVSNVGFRADGSNHTDHKHHLSARPVTDIQRIEHPATLKSHEQLDLRVFDKGFLHTGQRMPVTRRLVSGLARSLRRHLVDRVD